MVGECEVYDGVGLNAQGQGSSDMRGSRYRRGYERTGDGGQGAGGGEPAVEGAGACAAPAAARAEP